MSTQIPLAERIRPDTIDKYIGQEHLLAPDAVLYNALRGGFLPSLILWGPPGVGKTTLARLLAKAANSRIAQLSAISSGVKDLREIIEAATLYKSESNTVLFIDEIHRFNKSQQDALLGAVESGVITLIGATTENPGFEVISALLSRCQVFVLKPLTHANMHTLVEQAISTDEYLTKKKIEVVETEALFNYADGDARKLLNALELMVQQSTSDVTIINNELLNKSIQQKTLRYDKAGEMHYDIISAFIKSMRGSDPNAAVYYLARMIEAGEDPKFIARRMVILASEDIGNANPNALLLATSTFQAVTLIGMPESRIILSQCAIYLASSAKSNAGYSAINLAESLVKKHGNVEVPLHLRNGANKLLKSLDYGKDYTYAHNYDNKFKLQEYLPDQIKGAVIFIPGDNPRENEMRANLRKLWQGKYDY
ncbi:MAG: replication-associated recombination protein A [Bacteroidota bacterium]|nr:replication-associated recombination protein A [Bacteroidota bacterium]